MEKACRNIDVRCFVDPCSSPAWSLRHKKYRLLKQLTVDSVDGNPILHRKNVGPKPSNGVGLDCYQQYDACHWVIFCAHQMWISDADVTEPVRWGVINVILWIPLCPDSECLKLCRTNFRKQNNRYNFNSIHGTWCIIMFYSYERYNVSCCHKDLTLQSRCFAVRESARSNHFPQLQRLQLVPSFHFSWKKDWNLGTFVTFESTDGEWLCLQEFTQTPIYSYLWSMLHQISCNRSFFKFWSSSRVKSDMIYLWQVAHASVLLADSRDLGWNHY